MDETRSETVSMGEAAKRIGKSPQTVRRLIRDGVLTASRTRSETEYTRDNRGREIRGHWRVDETSLAAYLARRARAKQSASRG